MYNIYLAGSKQIIIILLVFVNYRIRNNQPTSWDIKSKVQN